MDLILETLTKYGPGGLLGILLMVAGKYGGELIKGGFNLKTVTIGDRAQQNADLRKYIQELYLTIGRLNHNIKILRIRDALFVNTVAIARGHVHFLANYMMVHTQTIEEDPCDPKSLREENGYIVDGVKSIRDSFRELDQRLLDADKVPIDGPDEPHPNLPPD